MHCDKIPHRLLTLAQHLYPTSNLDALIYKLFATAALAYTVLFFALEFRDFVSIRNNAQHLASQVQSAVNIRAYVQL